jgi:hypothetical protein
MSDLQKVGPDYGGSGTFKPFTADTTGAQRVQDAHARYFDAVRSGNVYALSARNLTLAAGQGYAQAAAATVNFVFWNPVASNKMLVLMKSSFATLSGTPAAGEVNYQLSAGNVITSTANGVHVNTFSGSITGSVARSWVKTAAAAIAGTVAFNDLRPAFAQSATAAGLNYAALAVDAIDGEIVLQPGMAFTFGVGGAGTTHVASFGLVWEELPLLV